MNIQKMLKQAQQMQQKLTDVQAELEARETAGSAGGGAVKLTLNGKSQLLRIELDADLLKPEEKEVLEDLILAAFNDAKSKVDSTFNDEMGKLTGGLQMPPGMKLPF